MGGCRCVFRDCQVSTQRNPKMHFFKLPARDPVRLEAWLKNCGNANILNVAQGKLSNRAVCARHFRYECFMNYKLDRLIPNQTPTLVRISRELAWDLGHLDENGEATMVKLTIPTLPHLIPPENFECPLGFTDDGRFGRKYAARRHTPPRPLEMEEIKRQKVVHVPEQQSISKTEGRDVKDMTGEEIGSTETLTVVDDETTHLPAVVDTNRSMSDQILEDLQHKYNELKANFDLISAENVALKEKVGQLESQQQACKVNGLTSSTPAPQLSKPQLYNGIRKYLGPRMATLVRMEMFGGGERPWKDDECEFAKELLQLGEDVYTHCYEEFRFRLPSLRMTRSWLHNSNPVDKEDNDL